MFSKNINLGEFWIERTVDARDIRLIDTSQNPGKITVVLKNGEVLESWEYAERGAFWEAKRLDIKRKQLIGEE